MTQQQYQDVIERLEDIERSSGRLRVRLDDTEEKLYLLEDRVESARIAAARVPNSMFDQRRAQYQQAPRPGTDTPTTSSQRSYSSPVTSSGPPPRMEMDPLAAPQDLPVVSVAPDAPEVVIDMSVYAERFNDEPALATDVAPTSRRPQPPVDVGAHRLPAPAAPAASTVAAADNANRVVLPTNQNDDDTRTPRQVYDAALEQFNNADYQGALVSLTQYVEMGASPDYLDNAYFWMGESHYGLGQYNRALASFQRVVSDYPNGNKVPDSLLKIALTHERMSQQNEARETLRMLVDTYPTTNAAERAAERLRALQ